MTMFGELQLQQGDPRRPPNNPPFERKEKREKPPAPPEQKDDADLVAYEKSRQGGVMQELKRLALDTKKGRLISMALVALSADVGVARGNVDDMVSMNTLSSIAEYVSPDVSDAASEIQDSFRFDTGDSTIVPGNNEPVLIDGEPLMIDEVEASTGVIRAYLDVQTGSDLTEVWKNADGQTEIDLGRIIESCSYTYELEGESQKDAVDLTMARFAYGDAKIMKNLEKNAAVSALLDASTGLTVEERGLLAPIIADAFMEERSGASVSEDFYREAEFSSFDSDQTNELYRGMFRDTLERGAELVKIGELSENPEVMYTAGEVMRAQVNMQIDMALIATMASIEAVGDGSISVDTIDQLSNANNTFDTGVDINITAVDYDHSGGVETVRGSLAVSGNVSLGASVSALDRLAIHSAELDKALETFAENAGDVAGAQELVDFDGYTVASSFLETVGSKTGDALDERHLSDEMVQQWKGLHSELMDRETAAAALGDLLESAETIKGLAKLEMKAHQDLNGEDATDTSKALWISARNARVKAMQDGLGHRGGQIL
ncbi:hypothetical protein HOI18_05540 [Candidatus Uhrbacteria bacterium]|jgi:hypothetical protein|nr:hypothetical protein [Candidatus Uhrbacteria bacterium]